MIEAFKSHPKATSQTIYSQPSGSELPPPQSSSVPTVDGAASPKTPAVTANEDSEKQDDIAPLFVPKKTTAASKTNSGSTGGLWGAPKKESNTNGLWKGSSVMWGPPKLDDVYEHGRGPKRRWTMTERD